MVRSFDSFDYWVGNDQYEFGLEVSGTLGEEIEQRHRMKVRQLLHSRHNVAGYVSVTSFRTGRSIFSFYKREEEDNQWQL